jgi:hypothetical protein
MKTYVNLRHLTQFFLEIEMFQTKSNQSFDVQ